MSTDQWFSGTLNSNSKGCNIQHSSTAFLPEEWELGRLNKDRYELNMPREVEDHK